MEIDYKKLYEKELKKNLKLKQANKLLTDTNKLWKKEILNTQRATIKNIGKGQIYNYKFSKKLAATMIKQKLVSFTKKGATIKFGVFKGKTLNIEPGEFIANLRDAFNQTRELNNQSINWIHLVIESKKIKTGYYGNDYGSKVGETERNRHEQIMEQWENSDKLEGIKHSQKKILVNLIDSEQYDKAKAYANKVFGGVSKTNNKYLIEYIATRYK